MAKLLPRKDVVIMGLGWTGSILAQELTSAGLEVLALERGPWRDTANDFNIGYMPDELRYAIRKELFLQPAQEAMTMRNNLAQTALPMRDYGSFLPGAGVGGAGVHWNGLCWRYDPSDFVAKSHLTSRYGAKKIADLQLQDWGVTFDEIEHCFDRFEYLCGTSGKAGVITAPGAGGAVTRTSCLAQPPDIPIRPLEGPIALRCSKRRRMEMMACILFSRSPPTLSRVLRKINSCGDGDKQPALYSTAGIFRAAVLRANYSKSTRADQIFILPDAGQEEEFPEVQDRRVR